MLASGHMTTGENWQQDETLITQAASCTPPLLASCTAGNACSLPCMTRSPWLQLTAALACMQLHTEHGSPAGHKRRLCHRKVTIKAAHIAVPQPGFTLLSSDSSSHVCAAATGPHLAAYEGRHLRPVCSFEAPVMTCLCCRYVNTTAVKSCISFIDGDKGILRYRGYPIEQLAEHSSFLEVGCAPRPPLCALTCFLQFW